ncbi:hypothetical protein EBU99_11335 [bacterium]|nr:hypothetical protein [bacterium]
MGRSEDKQRKYIPSDQRRIRTIIAFLGISELGINIRNEWTRICKQQLIPNKMLKIKGFLKQLTGSPWLKK